MPISGPESHSPERKDHTDDLSSASDPIDELMETLRENFRRGFAREKFEQQAAERRRIVALIVVLLVLAGLIVVVIAFRGSLHHWTFARTLWRLRPGSAQ
jgi:hypothetical protein